ncbi:uncharacterized protein UBRO_03897 [Ustilago bromivora]|uniref:Uncharacterized protein n=1 Tax=Ustilago bromivora TaxID=307758 RepID=A0A1K0FVJ1_9BASI|nr:uncharacterized protein UBRO_03897 [Ustilago bromivora]
MDLITAPVHTPLMPHNFSQGCSSGHQDDLASGHSQPSPSQRLLSRMLPVQAPPSQHAASRSPQPHHTSTSSAAASLASSTTQHAATAASAQSADAAPHKSSLRLSHPPPAPSSSHLHQVTPQSKRARIDRDSRSASSTTSPFPLSNNSLLKSNQSSAPTGPLSSPAMSNVRPLSGIVRPLPMPPTPSPSQRPPASDARNRHLIPMPQHSVEDLAKLLPPRQPAAVSPQRPDVPRRSVLQAIPAQPPLPILPPRSPVAQHQRLYPLPPAPEALPNRTSWSLTGFRSFDLDLDRIAEVQRLDQSRSDEPTEEQTASKDAAGAPAALEMASNHGRISGSSLGLPDRGLPSGSIFEVLGPPGSGKSHFVIQYAITERLRALGRARSSLMMYEDQDEASMHDEEHQGTTFTDSSYFSEDFWDAEIAQADQVLMIDCEGALTPERLAYAAWSATISLWTATRQHHSPANNEATHVVTSTEIKSSAQQRADMPEVVRRLVAAVLAGIHVSHVTSLADLIALLRSLRPTDDLRDRQGEKSLPSAMPARTSLILIDTLSYHIRSSGGSTQDRKFAAQSSERIRDMLLRLQKPYEYCPQPELTLEENEAAKQRCIEAASKLCTPTIVFTNQLGIRRGRDELQASGRASPSGRPAMGTSSDRSFGKNSTRAEGTSMLAPLLNGQRLPQSARVRNERPPPSVALCGPEMWDKEKGQAASAKASASPRQWQQLRGRSAGATQPMGHNRGWPLSFLGQDVWRILLFLHGTFGHRYAQMVSVPPIVQSELASLWTQARQRMRAREAEAARSEEQRASSAQAGSAAEQRAPSEPAANSSDAQRDNLQPSDAPTISARETMAENKDKQMLELLGRLRSSLFSWRPFSS